MRIVDEENNCGKGGKVESKNRAKNEMAVAVHRKEEKWTRSRESGKWLPSKLLIMKSGCRARMGKRRKYAVGK